MPKAVFFIILRVKNGTELLLDLFYGDTDTQSWHPGEGHQDEWLNKSQNGTRRKEKERKRLSWVLR